MTSGLTHEQLMDVSAQLMKAASLHQTGDMSDADFVESVHLVHLMLEYRNEEDKHKKD